MMSKVPWLNITHLFNGIKHGRVTSLGDGSDIVDVDDAAAADGIALIFTTTYTIHVSLLRVCVVIRNIRQKLMEVRNK